MNGAAFTAGKRHPAFDISPGAGEYSGNNLSHKGGKSVCTHSHT